MSFVYNGCEIGYLDTKSLSVDAVRDPTGNDVIHQAVTLEIRGVLNPDVVPTLTRASGQPVTTAGEKLAFIRDILMQPRRALTYTAGSGTVLSVAAGGDAAYGPEPLYCRAFAFTPTTILVEYGIRTYVRECDERTGLVSPWYSSLRWEDAVSIDRNGLCTHHRSGLLIVPRDSRAHPDDMRLLMLPAIPGGYRREEIEFRLDPSGLRMAFSFKDRQLVSQNSPPFPATAIQGHHMESINRNNQMRTGDIFLRLEGPPSVSSRQLFAAAARAAFFRMEVSDPQRTPTGRYLVGGSIKEDLSDTRNSVEVHFSWVLRPRAARVNGVGGGAGGIGAAGIPIQGIGALGPGGAFNLGGDAAGQIFGFGGPAGNFLGPLVSGLTRGINQDGKATAAVPMDVPWLGSGVAGSIPSRGIAPGIRGDSVLTLFAAALCSPCGIEATPSPGRPVGGGRLETGDTAVPRLGRLPFGGAQEAAIPFTQAVVPRVAIAPVPDDLQAVYADQDAGVYTNWKASNTYTSNPGVLVLPVTDSEGVNVAVDTHCPMMSVTCEWTAEKIDVPPERPNPQSRDDNLIFLGGSELVDNVRVAADGASAVYSLAGVYKYGVLDPSKVQARAPSAPFLDPTFSAMKALASWTNFGDALVDGPDGGSASASAQNMFDGSDHDLSGGPDNGPVVGA